MNFLKIDLTILVYFLQDLALFGCYVSWVPENGPFHVQVPIKWSIPSIPCIGSTEV